VNEPDACVAEIDDLLARLQLEAASRGIAKAIEGLCNAKDELAGRPHPCGPAVQRWIECARDGLIAARVGADVNAAARKLFARFGIQGCVEHEV
jgi:hypothetical protein